MANTIESKNQKIFISFSFLKNVLFANKIDDLNELIQNLGITDVYSFEDFTNFINKINFIPKSFITIISNSRITKNNIKMTDVIIRMCFNSVTQSKFKKGSNLSFVCDSDIEKGYLNVKNIFISNFNNERQEFESEVDSLLLESFVNNNNIDNLSIISDNFFNSQNIQLINKFKTENFKELEKWDKYFSFLEHNIELSKNNLVPFIKSSSKQLYKIKKSSPKAKNYSEHVYLDTINSDSFYLNISEREAQKENLVKVNVVSFYCLFRDEDLQNIRLIKSWKDISLLPLSANKNFSRIEYLKENISEIFNYDMKEIEKTNYTTDEILNIQNIDQQVDLYNFILNTNDSLFGHSKDIKELLNIKKKELEKMSVLRIDMEINLMNEIDRYNYGYISNYSVGDFVLVKRGKDVISKILQSKTKNPYLIKYLLEPHLTQYIQNNFSNDLIDNFDFIYDLNDSQKEAVVKAIQSNDLFVIQGPPGTGKTQVICEIVYQLSKNGKKVLISSQNHEAISNVMDRLKESPNINKVYLQNIINKKSNLNNFSPEKVVFNYYKSIKKVVEDKIDYSNNYLNSYLKDKKIIEDILINNKGLVNLYTNTSKNSNLLEELKTEINNLRIEKINFIETKNNIKASLFNLKNIIDNYNSFNFNFSLSLNETERNRINKVSSFILEKLLKKFSINEQENINNKLEAISNYFYKNNGSYLNLIDAHKNSDKEQIAIYFDRCEKDNVLTDFLNVIKLIKTEVNSLILDQKELELKYQNDEWIETKINKLQLEVNDLNNIIENDRDRILEISNSLDEELIGINNKYDLNLFSFTENIEEELKNTLNKIESEINNNNLNISSINNLLLDTKNFLELNYNINSDSKFDQSIKNQKLISDSIQLSSTILDDMINIYASSLTSNNLFKYDSKPYSDFNIKNINTEKIDFDVVIIDEASKATVIEILIPLMLGKKLILVGDYRQLPPIIKLNEDEIKKVNDYFNTDYDYDEIFNLLDKSLFKTLISKGSPSITTILRKQYRFNKDIMNVVNKFYDDSLMMDELISIERRNDLNVINDKGIRIINNNNSVYWINSSKTIFGEDAYDQNKESSTSMFNNNEIDIIVKLLERIDDSCKLEKSPKKIAIISFYGLQISKLNSRIKTLKLKYLSVIIGTVDDFQGKEADYVIVSLVRNPRVLNDNGRKFLKKYERINVAFSRARKLLIIVGSERAVSDLKVLIPDINSPSKLIESKPYGEIISYIKNKDGYLEIEDIL